MKILIILGIVAVVLVVLGAILCLAFAHYSRRVDLEEQARLAQMSPEERRAYEQEMYRAKYAEMAKPVRE